MKTLYLDPVTNDLTLDSSGNIAVASEPYSIAQDVASAAKTFLGECYYDTSIGIPYWAAVIDKSPPLSLVKSYFNNAAKTVPGVTAAQTFITSISKDRVLSGQIQVTTAMGATIATRF